jgi:hypothetical protein
MSINGLMGVTGYVIKEGSQKGMNCIFKVHILNSVFY